MTPQQAKELFEKLERLNDEIDLLDLKMDAAFTGKASERCPVKPPDSPITRLAMATINEKLGPDFISNSFW